MLYNRVSADDYDDHDDHGLIAVRAAAPPPAAGTSRRRRRLVAWWTAAALAVAAATAMVVHLVAGSSAANDDAGSGFLFTVHDAGETLGFIPSMEAIVASDRHRVQVLALAEPAVSLCSHLRSGGDIDVFTPSNVGVDIAVVSGNATRYQLLSEVEIVTSFFSGTRVVVVGMAYLMQAQLAHIAHKSM